MKKLISIFITGIILYLVVSGWNILVNVPKQAKPTTPAPTVTSGQAAGAEETEEDSSRKNQTYIKSTFVDMSGKKQVLDLGWIDLDNRPALLSDMGLATEYSQVLDGHYYYLRESQTGKNIILYRDKGEKVMETACDNEKEVIRDAFLTKNELFLLSLNKEELNNEEFIDIIKCVDLKTGAVVVMPIKETFDWQWITKKYIYIYAYEYYDWGCFDRYTGELLKNHSFRSNRNDANNVAKKMIDGKVYYMGENTEPGQPFSFVQVDMEKKEERVLFKYLPKSKKEEIVNLEYINEDGIYFMGYDSDMSVFALYKVPLQGGKMQCVFQVKSKSGFIYSLYKNHLVYVDGKDRWHHMNLRKHTDTIIGENFEFNDTIYSLQCGKEGIFIVKGADWLDYMDNTDDDDAKELFWENSFSLESYYMDYDGKNIKQLTKEVPLDVPSR